MNYKIYAQNPEHYDDQGLFIKTEDEERPWQTETDCEEFDAIHDPNEAGWSVVDLESAQRFASEIYILNGEVTEFEIYPN